LAYAPKVANIHPFRKLIAIIGRKNSREIVERDKKNCKELENTGDKCDSYLRVARLKKY